MTPSDFSHADNDTLMEIINKGAPQAANKKGIIDRSHPFWQAAAEFISRKCNIPTDEIFICWTMGLKASAGILWFHKKRQEVFLQRRKQEQIGLGSPAKWAFPGGGFIGVKEYETPAKAAMRHTKTKMGLSVDIPEFAAFHTIVKNPYGITNEGFTDDNSNIIGGDIYGMVMKYPMLDDEIEACLAQLDRTTFEVKAFNAKDFNAAVRAGETTLDPKEVEFINTLFSQ